MGSKKLGKEIRKARKEAKLTQKAAAQKAGITETYFAQIERAEVNPSIEIVENIGKVLKIKFTIPS